MKNEKCQITNDKFLHSSATVLPTLQIFHLSSVISSGRTFVMQSKADELENRLIDFAVRIIRLADSLPETSAGKHISRQLLRSGTSPAPNYAEARGAESNADFIHKLKVALKELNETSVWLRVVCRADLLRGSLVESLADENQQLCRILNATIKTSKGLSSNEK
jgi:four helix bundle protein